MSGVSDKRWVRRTGGGSPILKWETVGTVVEGRYLGSKLGKEFNGRKTQLGMVRAEDGTQITFPLVTALEGEFENIAVGSDVRIEYKGLSTSKAGRSFKAFDIDVAEGSPAMRGVEPMQPATTRTVGDPFATMVAKLATKVGEPAARAMYDAITLKANGDEKTVSLQLVDLLQTHGIAWAA